MTFLLCRSTDSSEWLQHLCSGKMQTRKSGTSIDWSKFSNLVAVIGALPLLHPMIEKLAYAV